MFTLFMSLIDKWDVYTNFIWLTLVMMGFIQPLATTGYYVFACHEAIKQHASYLLYENSSNSRSNFIRKKFWSKNIFKNV